ncbi:MAG: hypothetical protein IKH04_01810 [Kiritimatiellae bacterium]|nr:hypothetical protein [Kiritimatiellia bacterium]
MVDNGCISFEATENTKEHKDFVNSVSFVAKSNWQLALAIGNIFTLATFSNLDFAPRFARIEAANAKGRDMAKSSIMANPCHPDNHHTLPATGHLR